MRYLKTFWAIGLIAIVLTAFPTAAQGFSVTCDSGVSFDNGVEVRVQQMRAGFNYTATAIGIDGFDPILAVLDANGRGLCADNTSEASGYSVDLPTTGSVSGSQRSAQINFSQTSGQNMADVSLVVGSEGNISGEFVLMLEGMAATSADGQGDPFAVRLTPDMVNSGVPLTVYMVSVTDDLDPMIVHIDSDYNVVQDTANNDMYCDDAGDADTCWGESVNLGSSSVTWRGGRRIGGISTDSMLSIPLTGIALNEDPDFNFYNYLMTSYQQSSYGDYILVFHAALGSGSSGDNKGSSGTKGQQDTGKPTPIPPTSSNSDVPMGFSVTCDSGVSFDNGVEVIVQQMRAGFTYTATAIGIGDFDPVLAVLNQSGSGFCSDDESSASAYAVDLPTSGSVSSSNRSAQIRFDQATGQNMADVSLVVGSEGNTSGEFVLILEGMAATSADGQGDPFALRVTPGMVNSGVPLTVYMISVTDDLDPLIARINADFSVTQDADGNDIYCDDAGDAELCWGESINLGGSFVTRRGNQQLGGFGRDAMISTSLNGLALNTDVDLNFFNFLMTSYQQSTFGDYVLAFHVGLNTGSGADV